MLQLIALLLCVFVAILSVIPLQIAWMADAANPARKGGIIAGLLILFGGWLAAGGAAALSFMILAPAQP